MDEPVILFVMIVWPLVVGAGVMWFGLYRSGRWMERRGLYHLFTPPGMKALEDPDPEFMERFRRSLEQPPPPVPPLPPGRGSCLREGHVLALPPAVVEDGETDEEEALLVAFLQGASWWEWETSGATMWGADQDRAWSEAARRAREGTLGQRPYPEKDNATGGENTLPRQEEVDRIGG